MRARVGLLPVQTKVIHGMYSGAEVFALLDNPRPPRRRTCASSRCPASCCTSSTAASNVANCKKPVAEICVVYNRGVVLRGPEGVPTHCCLFARIPGDWKYDWVDFAKACRRARWEGPQELRIERVEG